LYESSQKRHPKQPQFNVIPKIPQKNLRKTNILGIFIDENSIFINENSIFINENTIFIDENTTSLEHLRKTNILGIFINENTISPEH